VIESTAKRIRAAAGKKLLLQEMNSLSARISLATHVPTKNVAIPVEAAVSVRRWLLLHSVCCFM
jgi:hypothetical protein